MLMNLNLHPQRRCASSSIRRLASLVLLAALAAAALSAGAASSSKRLDQANKIIQEAAADAAVQEHQKIYQRAAGLLNANKAAEAEQLLRPAIARLEDPPSTMTSPLLGGDLFLLARALRMQNRAQEALAPSERSVALLRAGSATILASALRERGTGLCGVGKYREAAAVFEEALALCRREYPAGDSRIQYCVQWSAEARLAGKFEPQHAVIFAAEYLAMVKTYGDLKSDDGAVAFINLTAALRENGAYAEALKTATTGLATLPDTPANKVRRAALYVGRGRTLEKAGHLAEARADFAQAVAIREQVLGRDHQRTRDAAIELARVEKQIAQAPALPANSGVDSQPAPASADSDKPDSVPMLEDMDKPQPVRPASAARPSPLTATSESELFQPSKLSAFDAEPELTEAEVKGLPADIATEWRAAQALGKDVLWSNAGSRPPLNLPRHADPAVPAPPPMMVDFTNLAPADYFAAVTLVKEHYRMLLGPMNDAALAHFNAKWAPLFANATPEMFKWLQAVAPPLAEFQSLRVRIIAAGGEFDDVMEEVKGASGMQNEVAVRALLSQAATARQELLAEQARLADVAGQIKAFGDPPNPIKHKARARLRHDDAVRQVRELASAGGACWVLSGVTLPKKESAAGNHLEIVVKTTTRDVAASNPFGGTKIGSEGVVRTEEISRETATAYWTEPPPRLRPAPEAAWGARRLTEFSHQSAADQQSLREVLERLEKEGAGGVFRQTFLIPQHRFGEQKVYPGMGGLVRLADPAEKLRLLQTGYVSDPNDAAEALGELHEHDQLWAVPAPLDSLGAPAGQRLRLQVKYGSPYGMGDYVVYEYRWDETGDSLKPFVRPDASRVVDLGKVDRKGGTKVKVIAKPKVDPPPKDDSIAQQIKTYQENIDLLQLDLTRLRQRLGEAKSDGDREFYQRLILGKEAEAQAHRDFITTLQTGNWTHTRTAWEDAAQQTTSDAFIRQMQRSSAFRRILNNADTLIAHLPVEEQFVARQELQRAMMAASATTDLEAARKAAEKIQIRARTYQRNEGDRWALRGDTAAAFEDSAQKLKTVCDTSLNILSMGGGKPILCAYQAATGYIEGGPAKAVETVVRSYSEAVDYGFIALEGYRESGGAEGAAQAIAWQWVQNKVMEKVMGKLMGEGGHGAGDVPPPTLHEQFEAAKWKQEVEWGKAQVKQFEDAQSALLRAGKAGAAVEEITRLQGHLRGFAIAINASPMAKNVIKYHAPSATGRAFDLHMQGVYGDVDRITHQTMREWHWNMDDLTVRDFRNSSSFGHPNMDRDYGLDELQTMARQGLPYVNLTQGGPTQRRSVAQFQGALTKSYNDSYKRVTGYSAESAAQAITSSSAHNEGFKDVCVLEGRAPDAAWIGQTMDVIRFKVNLPFVDKGSASFSHWTKMQESARGFGKELDKKLLPILNNTKPVSHPGTDDYWKEFRRLEQTRGHMEEMKTLCDSFGQGNMDPLTFRHELWKLTGGKSLNQVTDEVGTLIEGIVKFKANKT